MPFISYAQNSEDVMLWRAFRDAGPGFYVDVGAAHPEEDSVTRAFYDRGWRGINIEASPDQARRIRDARPRDVTLAVAAGDADGEVELQLVAGTGLSTTDGATAAMLREAGYAARAVAVPLRRLDGILARHAAGVIHFLKIDVEGAERAVIAGCDFARHRPRVVLVEATRPMSTEQTHGAWEGLLLAGGYQFAFFDGLNRFYVADECAGALLPLLSVPVNVLDDYVRVSDAPWAARAAAAAARAAAAEENAELAYARGFRHAAEAGSLRVRFEAAEVARAEAVERWLAADAWGHACDARTADTEVRLRAAEAAAASVAAELAEARGRLAALGDAMEAGRRVMAGFEQSTSWRVTRPLRAVASALGRGRAAEAGSWPAPVAGEGPMPPAPVPGVVEPVVEGGPVGAGEPEQVAPASASVASAAGEAAGSRAGDAAVACWTVNQFHAGSAVGDAVTNCMLLIRARLRGMGYRSDIFVAQREAGLEGELHLVEDLPQHAEQVLIVHHSLGYEGLEALLAHPAAKVLYYHNITPPEWLPAGSAVQELAALGRRQLRVLRQGVVAALAPSEFSVVELRRHGFQRARACNLLFDVSALPGMGAERGDEAERRFTVLFVGRVIESKAQADLVDAFAAFRTRFGRPSRLVLVGRTDGPGEYLAEIGRRIEAHGLRDEVVVTGPLTDAGLAEAYRAADLYVSMSRHEGFGVPLVEAVAYGVPVLAWPGAAVPFVLGAGLLEDRAAGAVAARMLEVAGDAGVRERLRQEQRAGIGRFTLARQWPAMQEALLLAGAVAPVGEDVREALGRNAVFTITGHTVGSYSLAAVNRSVAAGIEAERPGHVRLVPIEGGGETLPEGLRGLVGRGASTGPEVVISQHYPVHVPAERGDLALALLFWEESLLPAAMVGTLSEGFDGVLAPSRFVAKALVDSGVRRPVRVVGQAPDLGPFAAVARARERAAGSGAAGEVFTFLHVSSCFPRKGVDVLLAAFARAFRAGDAVRLVIKGFANPHNTVLDQVAALRAADPGAGAIEVIEDDLDEAGLLQLFEAADAMVLPTRGEGLNLPAAEALASGLPLIVTELGGHMDFCDAGSARLLRYRLAPSGSHLRSGHSLWAEPDVDDLVAALREAEGARRDPELAGAVAARAERGRTQVARALDRGGFVRRVAAAAVSLLLAPPRAPIRVAWMTSWNARCGVAEYARHLIGALPGCSEVAGHVVLADDREASGAAAAEQGLPLAVTACWRDGEGDDFGRLRQAVARTDPDVVVVQHQPGLVPWRGLPALLGGGVMGGRVVVVTLHNTRDIPGLPQPIRDGVVRALGGVARVVVHTVADLERLERLGLGANVALLPHGVVTAGAGVRRRAVGEAPLIGCYGFFLPGKGIAELIEAVGLLRGSRPGARLRLVNADYGVAASRDEIARCEAVARDAGLGDAVEWETRFLADAESRALLAACDVIVIPTQGSNEASSAAVRTALAAGRPVMTTPLRLFDDVGDAVWRSAGVTPVELAAGVEALLGAPEAAEALLARADGWLRANAWPEVAARFEGMLVGLAAGRAGLCDET